MSRFAREGGNANAALLVSVFPADFEDDHPLAGVRFQQRWERAAFELGGRGFRALAPLMCDFLQGVGSAAADDVEPTYPLGVNWIDLSLCLPDFVVESLREAAREFDHRMRGFATRDAVLTGVETRSSSPVRVERDDTLQSTCGGSTPAGRGRATRAALCLPEWTACAVARPSLHATGEIASGEPLGQFHPPVFEVRDLSLDTVEALLDVAQSDVVRRICLLHLGAYSRGFLGERLQSPLDGRKLLLHAVLLRPGHDLRVNRACCTT